MRNAWQLAVDGNCSARSATARVSFHWIVLTGKRSLSDMRQVIQGFRIVTDQSKRSMMAMVINIPSRHRDKRIVVIPKRGQVVTVASSMSIFGGSLQNFLSANGTLVSEMSGLVAGTNSPISGIDQNMAETQTALAANYFEPRHPGAV